MLALLNLLAILASGLAGPPPDRGPWLAIRPAEFVTVEIHPDGGWRVLDRGPAEPADDRAEQAMSGLLGGAPTPPKAELPTARPDTVRFVLKPTARGMMLLVSNGYGRRLEYRGVLRRQAEGRPEPSSVCPVLGRLQGIEDWPYPFAELDVGAFQLVEETRQPMVCR
ncbi:hypothetical protein [Phenylobacterium sp.]|uniref:hypothetical protein n=1 Tax=Phenylobacterium sp. TaxID=1871053 RepID=UPI003BAAB204